MTSLTIPRAASWFDALRAPASASVTGTQSSQNETPRQDVTFAFVRTRAGFDELEADWNSLFDRAAHSHQLFQSFNWLWHWCNHFLDEKSGMSLSILVGRADGKVVMIWPLVRETTAGITELTWMGDPMSQYGDVLIEQMESAGDVLRAAWRHIQAMSGADVVRLRKVRKDARVTFLLEEREGEITERLVAPFLNLASAPNFAEYEKRYSSGSRRNRKRLFRRLDEQGAVTLDELDGGESVRHLMPLIMNLKRRWLASRGLVSKAFADDRITNFFADAAEGAVRPCGCRLAMLSTAGRPAAFEIAVRCKERIALHVIVYDLDFEKSGAGILLLEQSIRNASNSGVKCYDLLAPGDTYKLDWADGSVDVMDWALPLSLKGRIFSKVYLGFLRDRLKQVHSALPTALRQRLSGRLSRVAAAA